MNKPAEDAPSSEDLSDDPDTEEVSTVFAESLAKELVDVEPGVRQRVTRVATQVFTRVALFAGPLPPPSVYRGYDEVFPGSAERLLTMAEQNQRSRHQWYSSAMANMRLGLIFGFIIALLLVGEAITSLFLENIWACAIFLGFGAISMVPALIKGRDAHRMPEDTFTQQQRQDQR